MNILFVCKYNNFRSKFAEAIFNKLNTDTNYSALSAGVVTDGLPPAEMLNEINLTAQELGYGLAVGKRNYKELVDWADVIINVADDVQLEIPDSKKVVSWLIADATDNVGVEGRKLVVEKIRQKVAQFISELAEKQ